MGTSLGAPSATSRALGARLRSASVTACALGHCSSEPIEMPTVLVGFAASARGSQNESSAISATIVVVCRSHIVVSSPLLGDDVDDSQKPSSRSRQDSPCLLLIATRRE